MRRKLEKVEALGGTQELLLGFIKTHHCSASDV